MRNLQDLSRPVSLGPRGHDYIRAAIALGVSKGDPAAAAEYAARRWGATSRAATVTKGAIEAVTTGSFGPDLEAAASEFFAAASAGAIVGRLAGLRRVPLRTRILTASGAVAHWVGEGQAKPVSNVLYARSSLAALKVLAVAVATRETFESTDAQAEAAIRADMLRVVVEALDVAFITPSNTGVADVMPASVTNGVAPVTWGSSPSVGLANLVAGFDGDLDAAYLVMHPITAMSFASAAYPRVGARGGDLAGVPVITSRSVPATIIALIDPTGIAHGEAAGELRAITQGSVMMDDAPVMAAGGGSPNEANPAQLVSLWQTDTIALLVGRSVNWSVVRTGAVALAELGAAREATRHRIVGGRFCANHSPIRQERVCAHI